MTAILGVLTAFGLILAVGRTRLPLWVGVLLGAVLVALWFGMPVPDAVRSAVAAMTGARTLTVVAIVALILTLSRIMDRTGQMGRMVDGFGSMFRAGRLRAASLPALIGLLPMPGGAIMSAPLVEASVGKGNESPERLTALNYWFRHVWEFWWPLYPGVILAIALSGEPEWRFMLRGAALTPVAVAAGWWLILRGMRPSAWRTSAPPRVPASQVLRDFAPILLVIVVVMVGKAVSIVAGSGGSAIRQRVFANAPLFVALLGALAMAVRMNRLKLSEARRLASHPLLLPLILLVVAIMVFRGILIDSGAMGRISEELVHYNVPVVLVVAFLPLLAGVVTGIAIGFVGSSFPLIVALVGEALGGTHSLGSYVFLAYAFGFCGMMLSPLHVCFMLTRRYFGARLLGVYPFLLGTTALVAAAALLMFAAGI